MSEPQILKALTEWYSEQCDGEWEHGNGVRIDTLDNPGWMVEINLGQTRFQDVAFEAVDIDKGKDDWLNCYKDGSTFIGAGDPSKIAAILEVFLKFVGKL